MSSTKFEAQKLNDCIPVFHFIYSPCLMHHICTYSSNNPTHHLDEVVGMKSWNDKINHRVRTPILWLSIFWMCLNSYKTSKMIIHRLLTVPSVGHLSESYYDNTHLEWNISEIMMKNPWRKKSCHALNWSDRHFCTDI